MIARIEVEYLGEGQWFSEEYEHAYLLTVFIDGEIKLSDPVREENIDEEALTLCEGADEIYQVLPGKERRVLH